MLENQAKIVYLGIGSNLGNKKNNIETAKFKLQTYQIDIMQTSRYYETKSWPDENKPKFINIMLKVKTNLSPNKILNICNTIELELGRKRSAKNAPRTCDIDIIDYDQEIINLYSKNLIIPHPAMVKRNFVLFPLFEIDKNWKHPLKKKKIHDLIGKLDKTALYSIKQI